MEILFAFGDDVISNFESINPAIDSGQQSQHELEQIAA
jgi:hypothetical protein